MTSNPIRDAHLSSPMRRLIMTLGIAMLVSFFAEVLIMFALPHLAPNANELTLTLIDASLLSVVLAAFILPLMLYYRKRDLRVAQRATRLRHVLDQHAIVSIADVTGRITFVNEHFCNISGYTQQELMGQNHRLLKSDQHSPEFYQAMWRTIALGNIWHGDVCNRSKAGSLYWVHSTITPFMNERGKPEEYISIRTEITTQKVLERNLKQQQTRMGTILDHLGEGVYLTDEAGHLIYLNSEAKRMLGWSLEELAGKGLHDITHHHRPDGQPLPAAECPIFLAMRANRVYRSRDEVFFHKDGSALPVKVTSAPLLLGGELQGSVTLFSDVREERRSQQRLLEAKEEAERANRAKSDFLSSMSHELRTPMNAILGFSQILEYDSALNAEQHDNVQEILKGGRHLLALINEVLDLAKIESGRIELSLEPVNLASVVDDCRPLIQTQAGARQIALFLDVPEKAVVRADRTRLKQVLLNLLSNAVKYNRQGGNIRLGVQAATGERWRVSVSDTGHGIAPERLAELFLPFNRLDVQSSEIEGTGIGLTITRRLLELMNGQVGVSSQIGVGSCFWFELPSEVASPGAKTPIDEPAAQHAPPRRQHQVLYVDDSRINLKLVALMLGRRPHINLVTTHLPEMAFELALNQLPDLVLLDINMSGMDRYEVLSALKADDRLRSIPVFAITADAMPGDIERGRAAGFNEYMAKPLYVGQFLKTIDRYLDSNEGALA